MSGNDNLHMSKAGKTDEFYTQLTTIEDELRHYRKYFKGKTVLCNCDDPYESNFFKYFTLNFNALGLKKTDYNLLCDFSCSLYTTVFFGEEETVCTSGEGRKPYKIEITEVKGANGDTIFDLSNVEYLLKNDKNVITLLESDGYFCSVIKL